MKLAPAPLLSDSPPSILEPQAPSWAAWYLVTGWRAPGDPPDVGGEVLSEQGRWPFLTRWALLQVPGLLSFVCGYGYHTRVHCSGVERDVTGES